MDLSMFRRLAARAMRLADAIGDPDEAARLRMMAADYLDKANQIDRRKRS
jgi:hypothetical protein